MAINGNGFSREGRKKLLRHTSRIVIKFCSNVLSSYELLENSDKFLEIAELTSKLKKQKKEIIIVIPAAIGANILQQFFASFTKQNLTPVRFEIAQEVLSDEAHFNGVIEEHLKKDSVPIIIEKNVVGDSDLLSAKVAKATKAELLIILADADGLYVVNSRSRKSGVRLMEHVLEINPDIEMSSCTKNGKKGSSNKLIAAKYANSFGIPVILANGKNSSSMKKVFEGEPLGTFFESENFAEEKKLEGKLDARKRLMPKLKSAKENAAKLSLIPEVERKDALITVARAISAYSNEIMNANQLDMANARSSGQRDSAAENSSLDKARIKEMSAALQKIADMNHGGATPLKKSSSGVIGIIFESEPKPMIHLLGLCLISGNAVLLKGEKGTSNTNNAIAKIIKQALKHTAVPADAVHLLETGSEEEKELMKARDYIDFIVPIGSANLLQSVKSNSLIPLLNLGYRNDQ